MSRKRLQEITLQTGTTFVVDRGAGLEVVSSTSRGFTPEEVHFLTTAPAWGQCALVRSVRRNPDGSPDLSKIGRYWRTAPVYNMQPVDP